MSTMASTITSPSADGYGQSTPGGAEGLGLLDMASAAPPSRPIRRTPDPHRCIGRGGLLHRVPAREAGQFSPPLDPASVLVTQVRIPHNALTHSQQVGRLNETN